MVTIRYRLLKKLLNYLFKYPVYLGSIVFSFGNKYRLLCETRLCSGICRRHRAQNRNVLDVREELSTGPDPLDHRTNYQQK